MSNVIPKNTATGSGGNRSQHLGYSSLTLSLQETLTYNKLLEFYGSHETVQKQQTMFYTQGIGDS